MSGRESTEDKRVMQNQLDFAKKHAMGFHEWCAKQAWDSTKHRFKTTSELYDEFIKHD